MTYRSRLASILAALVAGAGLVGGCTESPTSPSSTAPFSQVDLREGAGAEAVSTRLLTVHYTGWLYNPARTDQKGARFDSSSRGTPFTFTLGAGQVIQGWEQGIVGMKVDGLRRLVIPPSLAYGPSRSGRIPPNATLVFEVELLSVD